MRASPDCRCYSSPFAEGGTGAFHWRSGLFNLWFFIVWVKSVSVSSIEMQG